MRELGSHIFVALPLFYAFTGCDIVSRFYGKGKSVKHMMFGLKVKGKMISLMFSSSYGKSLPM